MLRGASRECHAEIWQPNYKLGGIISSLQRMETVMKALSLAAASISLSVVSVAPVEAAGSPVEPSICQVTRPGGGAYANDSLSVGLPRKFVFRPGGPGFVDSDGALGIKVLWTRKTKGLLQVGGRRLDGSAPPPRAYIHDLGDTGIQPSYLVFPTPGCWEITGKVGDSNLTFVVLVEKIGDGPAWRFQGPGRGSRISSVQSSSS